MHKIFPAPGNYATSTHFAGYFRNVAWGHICWRRIYPAAGGEGVNHVTKQVTHKTDNFIMFERYFNLA